MNLYLCHNLYGDFYVLAEHPTEAQEKTEAKLDEADYGVFHRRRVTDICLLARLVTNEFNGKPFFSDGARLIL